MWDNFIGQQIRRCNRNLLIANLVLLVAIIAYVSSFDYKEEGWSSLVVSVPLFLLAVWNFVKWKNRTGIHLPSDLQASLTFWHG